MSATLVPWSPSGVSRAATRYKIHERVLYRPFHRRNPSSPAIVFFNLRISTAFLRDLVDNTAFFIEGELGFGRFICSRKQTHKKWLSDRFVFLRSKDVYQSEKI